MINKVRGRLALGYTGPRSFAPRADGTELPVVARDYSSYIGLRHDELDYYTKSRHAANIMADLINDTDDTETNSTPKPGESTDLVIFGFLGGEWVPQHQMVISVDDGGFRQGVTAVERLRTYGHAIFERSILIWIAGNTAHHKWVSLVSPPWLI